MKARLYLVLALSCAPAQASQLVAAPVAERFAADYDAALRLTESRRWAQARDAWLALLRTHAGAAHARPRLPEIRELLRQCSFWIGRREPDPRALVEGELVSYDRVGGRIRMRFDLGALGDLESLGTEGQARFHPMMFRAPYTLELSGTVEELAQVVLIFASCEQSALAVRFGSHLRGEREFQPHVLYENTEGVSEQVDQASPPEADADEHARALVRVDATDVSIEYQGERIFRHATQRRGSGGWGLIASEPFGELVVAGVVETAWIDGLVDAHVQRERERFDARYRDPVEFDAWPSVEPGSSAEEALQRALGSLAERLELSESQAEVYARIADARRQGRLAEAVDMLDRLEPDELPPGVAEIALALCELAAKRARHAAECLERSAALRALTPELRLLHAHLLGASERVDVALAILHDLSDDDDLRAPVLAELAALQLGSGRLDEARATIERALADGTISAELDRLRACLVKASLGPGWRRSYPSTSQFASALSDLDSAVARAAAREFDDTWRRCCKVFGELDQPRSRARVYVFSGRSSYLGYTADVSGSEPAGTLGVYSAALDQICAWNPPRRSELLATLRHECVHRYLNLALGALPRWFDEGHAEYLAGSKLESGAWRDGAVDERRRASLRAARLRPLDSFVRESPEEFLRSPSDSYPEAWAFVHFLRHGRSVAGHAFLAALWRALARPTDALSAVEDVWSEVDAAALQREFDAHVLELLRQR